jgi:peroxiredoxin
MKLTIGDMAPDFTLYDTERKQVTLAELRVQNVLLLFFPLAFTSTCTEELCSIRDNLGWYQNVNARILGISVDSPHTLAKYKEDQQLNFTLLSDFNKEVSTAYGSIYDMFGYNMQGVSKRSAFIIDHGGVIQYGEVLENASRIPNFQVIQKVLSTL